MPLWKSLPILIPVTYFDKYFAFVCNVHVYQIRFLHQLVQVSNDKTWSQCEKDVICNIIAILFFLDNYACVLTLVYIIILVPTYTCMKVYLYTI